MENIFTHWESVINLTRNDIVFEYQNKQYGAYAIRKYYPERLRNAFIYSVTGMLLLFAVPLGLQKFFPAVPHIAIPKNVAILVDPPIYYPDVKPEVTQIKQEKKVKSEGTNYVATNERVETNPDPQIEQVKPTEGTVTTDGSTASTNSGSTIVIPVDPPSAPVLFAAVMPTFDGLEPYLIGHTVYPPKARELGISGKVYVTFVVDRNGKVVNAVLARRLDIEGGELLEAEALRVVRSMPDWKPGRNESGQAVAVLFTLPINFVLR